jgi:hypothetical protein
MDGRLTLDRDFKEFIESLNANDVRYLVVGGYAVAFHGHPRYTKDLDIWIELNPENAARIIRALHDFGFGSLDLTEQDFLTPDQVVQLGYPPYRIDLLSTLAGVDFEACYAQRVETDIAGVRVAFIDVASLRKNKRAVGRHQDLADLENLE